MTDAGTPVEWRPCSDRARERSDPLAGTGPRGIRWLLIEVPAAWGPKAFLDPPFDPVLGRAIVTRAEAEGMRVLAIRRTGRERHGDAPGGAWAIADSRPGQESMRWGRYADLEELRDVPLDGSSGVASDRLVFGVCTHGRHDQCCAVRGRQVVAGLAAAYPEETWECSHLGGDRFAGTMVMLPHGLYYGYADDADAAAIAAATLDGRVVDEFYRGRSSLSHPVQAAQHFAREALGGDRIDDWAPLAEARTEDGWTVTLQGPAGPVEIALGEEASAPLLSTCAARRPVQVRHYRLDGIRDEAPAA